MPQIDEAQLIPLLSHLAKCGVECFFSTRPATHLSHHQDVDKEKVHDITSNEEALNKPLLVSTSGVVLDGNHRAAALAMLHRDAVVMVVPLPYEDALLALAEAPMSYSYGDGNFHPITQ